MVSLATLAGVEGPCSTLPSLRSPLIVFFRGDFVSMARVGTFTGVIDVRGTGVRLATSPSPPSSRCRKVDANLGGQKMY